MRQTVATANNNELSSINNAPVYLPGLNGLRAIAALAVVVSHTTLALDEFGLDPNIFGADMEGKARGLDLAGNGVTIFFVLSGFLISFLLMKEKEIHPLKIKDFYIRRALRIWPLYYLYLALALLTAFLYHIPINREMIFPYVFMAANIPFILQMTLPFLSHYWSLGVEEQFYLFFPQLACLSNKRLLNTSLILIVFFLLLKVLCWFLQKKYGYEIPLATITVTRFHVMLMGVVAAILYYQENKLFLQVCTHKAVQALAWIGLLFIAMNRFHFASVIDGELVAVIAVVLIMGQVTKRNPIINLENRVCDFIGKISYGIYVIHPLLIFYVAQVTGKLSSQTFIGYLFVYTIILLATIVVAYLSYTYFEKPFLRWKQKFTTIKSAASMQRL